MPCWVAYVVRWRVMAPLAPELLPLTVWMPFKKIYLPWAAVHLAILLVKPYSPLKNYEMLFDWYVGSVAGEDGTNGKGKAGKKHAPPFRKYWWKPAVYLLAHGTFSLEGYCAAALSLRFEAVMLTWVSLIFVSNINSAFSFYRASVDPEYSPGNKLVNGLQQSAMSWCIIGPLYLYCERASRG